MEFEVYEISDLLTVNKDGFYNIDGDDVTNTWLEELYNDGVKLHYFGQEFLTHKKLDSLVKARSSKEKQKEKAKAFIQRLRAKNKE